MAFSSSLFLFFFVPLFFFFYFLSPEKYRKYVLILGSYLFYGWGAPTFSVTLLLSMIIDWSLGNRIYLSRDKANAKTYYLLTYIVFNLGLLTYFKYTNFFIDNLNNALITFNLASTIQWAEIVAPLGISFIFFHKISYAVDIYSLKERPAKFSDYALYILFFPKILAGPIVKYQDIANQLICSKLNQDTVIQGTFRFSKGLSKKVIIADTLSVIANKAFLIPSASLDFSTAWLGIICYTFQIYFDFSGYSDMAIGLAKVIGINFPENFDKPYTAQSFTEFWKRWHITLSGWLREYVYFPLGGNRCSMLRNYSNIMVVFLISGLWHGANWTYIIWGIYHGSFVVLDKIIWLKLSKKTPKALNIILTFFLIIIGWALFKSDSMREAIQYLASMFNFFKTNSTGVQATIYLTNFEKFTVITASFFSFIPAFKPRFYTSTRVMNLFLFFDKKSLQMMLSITLLTLAILRMISSTHTSFIYFTF